MRFLVSEANDAAAKGDMGCAFAITKKLKSGHDKTHKVIKDESRVLLVEEEIVAARWRRHRAELMQGQAGNDCQKKNSTLEGNERTWSLCRMWLPRW